MTAAVVVPIELQLTPRSREVMESLARIMGSRFVAQEPEAAEPAAPSAARQSPPAIGQPWPGLDAVYAGVSRGEDGEPDAHLVVFNTESDGPMKHKAGAAWAKSLGDGMRLPTKREGLLISANVPEIAVEGRLYWLNTQFSAYGAWAQDFSDGSQSFGNLDSEAWCRPVRRLPL